MAVEGVRDAAQHHAQGKAGPAPLPDQQPVGVGQEERVAAARDEELLDRLVVRGLRIAGAARAASARRGCAPR